jgi:hypothetical protein
MKVKCIATQMKASSQQRVYNFSARLFNWDVVVGSIYTVYAI